MTNDTTAPERIWLEIEGLTIYPWKDGNLGKFDGSICEYCEPTEYVRADALEAAQARIAELEQHIADMIDDSGQECACGYDNPTDICLGHLPMYRKAQARIAELEQRVAKLEDCLRAGGRNTHGTALENKG